MRAVMMWATFLTGAATMTDQATAAGQDKKAEKQAVTFRRWIDGQKMFINAVEIKAEYRDTKGRDVWRIYPADLKAGGPTVGSEIIATGKDGEATTWVIEKISGGDPAYICECRKKHAPKQPE